MSGDDRIAFLVGGVQKGGTTALFDYLSEHPGLCMPACKEVHFFDDESVDWADPDYAAYHAQFEPCAEGTIRGEATPIYIYWPDSLERIAAYNPAMKLILVFRDPVERAWSHWRMETARGAETEPFSWCIREGRARVAANPHPAGAHRVHSYVERGFYGAQLAHALGLFPRDQLLCLRSEDLLDRPDLILRQVCDFLHAPELENVSPRLSHVGVEIAEAKTMTDDDRTYLNMIYRDDQKLFNEILDSFSPKPA
jgi:hypothetical protein